MTYYKCLFRSWDDSLISPGAIPMFREKYEVGVEKRPTLIPGSKLFVFDNLDNVHLFKHSIVGGPLDVYECRVHNPEPLHVIAQLMYERFWKGDRRFNVSRAPVGTFICDALLLMEKVLSL